MSKIIGVTVGTTLPKPNFKQTDPTKGDYIKNKPDFDGLKSKVEQIEVRVDNMQESAYDDTELRGIVSENVASIDTLTDLVGNTKVETQISDAVATLESEIDDKLGTMQSEIDSKVDAVDGKGLSTNDYTDEEQQKLRDIESGANYYEHPAHSSHDLGLYKVTVDGEGHVSETSLVEKEDILAFVEKDDIVNLGFMDEDSVSSEISDLNDRIDGVEGNLNTTNETLNGISEEFENYKTTNNEVVSTNASGIEANKTAIEVIQGDYLTSTDKTQLQDGINEVSNKATANAAAIEILNGEGDGSVKQSIDNAFNEFAANVTNDDVVNTYKELIDYAAKHGPEFTELVGEVDDIEVRVGEIETDLSDYKTSVSDQFAEIDTTISNHIDETQEALEGKADLEHEHNDLYYTKDEILESITVEDIDDICEFTSGGEDLASVATEEWVRNNYQTKGDYLTSVPAGYATETYVNNKIAAIPTPDVSGQINTHNTSNTAHSDIRKLISDTIDDFTNKIEDAGSIDIDFDGANAEDANPVNADTLGGYHASQYAKINQTTPRNLLDNSDFTNPINQRANTSYTTQGYTIDRWIFRTKNDDTVTNKEELTIEDGGIRVTKTLDINNYTAFKQSLNLTDLKMPGKTVTFVVHVLEATCNFRIRITGGTSALSDAKAYAEKTCSGSGIHFITYTLSNPLEYDYLAVSIYLRDIGNILIEWAALYEGEYTAETLPKYQPKGYGAELAECQRYFFATKRTSTFNGYFSNASKDLILGPILELNKMRVEPTVIVEGSIVVRTPSGYSTADGFTTSNGGDASLLASFSMYYDSSFKLCFNSDATSTNNTWGSAAFKKPVCFSADL